MKQFFKMMFASTLGALFAFIVGILVTIILIASVVTWADHSETEDYTLKPDETLFKLSFSGTLYDSVEDNALSIILGEESALSLKDILNAVKKAKEQEVIQGIYLDMGMFSAGVASMDAIRRALIDFRESGKFVIAYADHYTQSGYYLASVADRVYLNPQGMLGLTGIASQTLFYKGLLQKAGIEMMVFKVGTYKGAVEPFIGDRLSDANREQITSYQKGIWKNVVAGIAESRHIPAENVNHFADEGLFFSDPSNAVECGLIDGLEYRNDVEKIVMKEAGQSGRQMNALNVAKMKRVKSHMRKYRNRIAVVYAEGEITQNAASSPFDMTRNQITERTGDELRKLKHDERVKAVVIRVNSPGGSAYISDQIWKQVAELKKSKPVVVSMGNVAASGGYYISCAASKIVAEANTLTGSIGIFGIFPNMAGLFEKLALTADVVKTNRYADLGDVSRPMNDEEKALIQGHVERGYDTFLARCAEGRGMSREAIDAIGQGRVWTGEQALELGLVDELGGIDRAIELAAELAKIYNYTLIHTAASDGFFKDFLSRQLQDVKASIARDMMGEDYEYFKTIRRMKTACGIQARIPYDLKPL
jgi:protease-4